MVPPFGGNTDICMHIHTCVHTYMYISSFRRQLEFLINDRVVPHNMTVFQAIKQFEHVSYYI